MPLLYVAAWGTSARCSTCGSKTIPNEHRILYCKECKTWKDRDVNAAENILAKGAVRFAEDGSAGEAVKGNETMTPILRVDADQLASGAGAKEAQQNHYL